MLEHAVLVDPGLVGERVLADHRLVALYRHAGDTRQQARGRHQAARVDARAGVVVAIAHAQRHDQFLPGAVPGAFADAVDGALDLAVATADLSQAVGHGQAQGAGAFAFGPTPALLGWTVLPGIRDVGGEGGTGRGVAMRVRAL